MRGLATMVEHACRPFGQAEPRVFDNVFDPDSSCFEPSDARNLLTSDEYRRCGLTTGHDAFAIVRGKQLVEASEYADLTHAEQIMQGGATAIFRHLQLHIPAVTGICVSLANLTQLPAHANSYWTTANSQGFPLHADPDTVLAAQISGSKTWLLFAPRAQAGDDPLLATGWLAEGGEAETAPLPETATHVVTMRPGQVLLVPRGWGHYALAVGESLHVSLGILHPEIDRDLVRRQEPVWPTG